MDYQVDERHERGNSLKAAFMLVREVSDSADMMRRGWDTINIRRKPVKRPQKEIQLINILKNYALLLC